MSSTKNFESTFDYKVIYIFRINDKIHSGCLKIGDATVHTKESLEKLTPNSNILNYSARQRIDSYTSTAGIVYELLHTELAVYKVNNKKSSKYGKVQAFRDYKVHEVLKRSGIKSKYFDTNKKQNEWFITDLSTAKKAIECVKKEKSALNQTEITSDQNPIIFRPEQQEAINKTILQYKTGDRMLWNAKMRFGKTLTSLQVAKEMNFNKTIIITHRPVVSEGWYEDFNKIFYDSPNYEFGSKTKGKGIIELINSKKSFVFFASMQDLRGSDSVGGNFDKNNELFSIDWDFVVVDEAHEGTQTKLGKAVLEEIIKPSKNYKTKVLELSGTPFNLLTNYEEATIYTWDYIMEQQAKEDWTRNRFGDSNPYEELPRLNIYTYHLEEVFKNFIEFEDKAFNFREFFRTWTGDKTKDFKERPKGSKIGDFVYENEIISFLNLITKTSDKNNYPFSTEEYRNFFRHTLWVLPGVKEAKALSNLLKRHPIFKFFTIVNVAGNGDEEIDISDALKAVQDAMTENPDNKYTITLTCGRLTTGVSVPEWTAVLMLSGSYSTAASQYLQTIFRVQTPANINGRMKENCYVFDFAPDRTLRMVCESIQLSPRKPTDPNGEKQLAMFLNFCPVISVDHSGMIEYKVSYLLQELKRAYAERVVRNGFDDVKLYNDELLKLDDLELNEFEQLKKIIGSTKQSNNVNEIEINDEGFTNEEYERVEKIKSKPKKELTEEEKELLEELKKKKDNKAKAISILRGISIRIPLLVYGVDKDIDVDITVDNFADEDLIDDLSWNEFMPNGVNREVFKKFAKYYDKNVFVAASRRIRFISKSADELEPTERVKKIASLFGTFKNPDKETVLTPWRVVNMHMSDCLGGYDFFDESHTNELMEPRYVDRGRVTKNTISNLDANILEINSKTGLYPLYLTYSLYRKHSDLVQIEDLTFDKKLELWDYVVQNQVFVVCKTPMAKSITKRTLIGYRNAKVNTRYFEDLINQLKQTNKLETFKRKMGQGKSYWNRKEKTDNMKFNAIVGNPPYQIMDGGGSGSSSIPIYNYFVQASMFIQPDYVSMIMPSRWFSGGKGLDDFRSMMINNKNIRIMHDYMNSNECFSNVSIEGGVCYFLWDRENEGLCNYTSHLADGNIVNTERYLKQNEKIDILIRDEKQLSILNKVLNVESNFFSQIVYPRNPFGIGSIEEYISDKKSKYKILGRFDNQRKVKYLDDTFKITKNTELIDKYKVFVSKADGAAGQIGNPIPAKILGKPEFGDINQICTETFLAIGPFDSKEQTNNVCEYMKTKFFRFMVGIRKNKNMTQDTYSYAPLLDFSEKWSDFKLYNKYNLTQEDIDYIEYMIKSAE